MHAQSLVRIAGRMFQTALSTAAGAFGAALIAAPCYVVTAAAAAATPSPSGAAPASQSATSAGSLMRPFRVNIPQVAIDDMRRRISATQWPEKETVVDSSQGVPLAAIRKLARHWASDYDWRKVEARLNALPQFMTEIDGLDIHFIQVRSRHPDALPLIVTHGWPGSIIEQLKIIDPLDDNTRSEPYL